VFTSERGGPFTTDATNLLVKGIRKRASLLFFRPRPHAVARLRLRAGQCRAGYAAHPVLARASEHPAHGALHGVERRALQGVLALPMTRGRARRLGV